jgi:hypothetical protein
LVGWQIEKVILDNVGRRPIIAKFIVIVWSAFLHVGVETIISFNPLVSQIGQINVFDKPFSYLKLKNKIEPQIELENLHVKGKISKIDLLDFW